MTKPLAQNRAGAFSLKAYDEIRKIWDQFDALAIGPGIGRDPSKHSRSRRQVITIIALNHWLFDTDALFALAGHADILLKAKAPRVLTLSRWRNGEVPFKRLLHQIN